MRTITTLMGLKMIMVKLATTTMMSTTREKIQPERMEMDQAEEINHYLLLREYQAQIQAQMTLL